MCHRSHRKKFTTCSASRPKYDWRCSDTRTHTRISFKFTQPLDTAGTDICNSSKGPTHKRLKPQMVATQANYVCEKKFWKRVKPCPSSRLRLVTLLVAQSLIRVVAVRLSLCVGLLKCLGLFVALSQYSTQSSGEVKVTKISPEYHHSEIIANIL